MIAFADIKRAGASLHLCVAAQTEVDVPLGQQLCVDRAVRVMAGGAALTQSGMFEDEGPRLLAVTCRTPLIESGHRQPSSRFENVTAMRIMTLRAVHFVFEQRMVLRQPEFSLDRPVTFETRLRVLPRIDDRLASTAPPQHVQAGRPVAGFAAGQTNRLRRLQSYSSVRTGWKHVGNVRVTLRARFVADEVSTGNFRR